jgi:hypothetical protein
MLASWVVMALASTPAGHSGVTLLDDPPRTQIRLVDDDDDDHLDRDQESAKTRAARLENERPSYFGPIALGVGGLALAGLGVLTVFVLNGALVYAIIPAIGGLLMIIAAVIWGVHRISERAEFDDRIKGLKGQTAEQWRAPVQLPLATLVRF